MAKIKLNKGELKAQRDALRQFQRYLPTLQLTRQLLLIKTFEAERLMREAEAERAACQHGVQSWAGLLADPLLDRVDDRGQPVFEVREYIYPSDVITTPENVAGVVIPVLEEMLFPECDYDLHHTPFWVDRAIERLRELVRHTIGIWIIGERIRLLQQELRTTTHRVNLFEKVKIPEARENIRRITIYLGDQQANAVGIAKAAKRKTGQAALP